MDSKTTMKEIVSLSKPLACQVKLRVLKRYVQRRSVLRHEYEWLLQGNDESKTWTCESGL